MIDDLLTDDKIPNSWYHSSVFIANKVFDTINKFAGPKLLTEIKRPALDLFYARGDTDVMGSITTLFKVVKEQTLAKNKGNPSAGKSIIPGEFKQMVSCRHILCYCKSKEVMM